MGRNSVEATNAFFNRAVRARRAARFADERLDDV
jgi:hypothetical protein